MIDLRSLSEPSVLITIGAVLVLSVTLTMAVLRTIEAPKKRRPFTEAMAFVMASEIDDIDTALNPDEKTRKSWSEYWLDLAQHSGRTFDDPSRPGIIAATVALFGAGLGGLVVIGGPFGAIIMAVALVGLLRAALMMEAKKRIGVMEKQLPSLLSSLRAHIQSGATPQQALLLVADDIPAPLGDELRVLKRELSVNVALEQALEALASRVPSREMKFLVSSVEIAVRAGESLDPQLTRIEEIVAQRTRLRQKLRSALAQVRGTQIIAALAVPGFFLNSLTQQESRDYWFSAAGFLWLSVATGLWVVGLYMQKRITSKVETA